MDNNNIFIRIADDNVLVVTMIYFSWFSEHIIEQWIGKFIMFDMYVIWLLFKLFASVSNSCDFVNHDEFPQSFYNYMFTEPWNIGQDHHLHIIINSPV